MKKYILTSLLVACVSLSSYAQKETAWWYFGYNVGLNFNELITDPDPLSPTSTVATDGTIVQNVPKAVLGPLKTGEGCFSVSTSTGRLLFSSDGSTVYNRDAKFENGVTTGIMENGTGLWGGNSSTQSGIVVPRPGSATQYFVVTVPQDLIARGIRYSVVDLSYNGGLGKVLDDVDNPKNKVIKAGAVFENIAVVPNTANNKDYWLIHRAPGEYNVWPITEAGIDETQVQVTPSPVLTTIMNHYFGMTVLSSDFTKLVSTGYNSTVINTANFNPYDGTITNIQRHPFPAGSVGEIPEGGINYGACFSPNDKYLYVTSGYFNNGQLYVSAWDNLTTGGVLTFLRDSITNVQKGLDGRLYGIHSYMTYPIDETTGLPKRKDITTRTISVIENPNEGATNIKIINDYLPIAYPNSDNNGAYLGLPTFAAGFVKIIPKPLPFACAENNRTYTVDVDPLITGNIPSRLEWDFGDASPIVHQPQSQFTSGTASVIHKYEQEGIYNIKIQPYRLFNGVETKLEPIFMEANVVNCHLKTNKMARIELLNTKELEGDGDDD